MTKPLSILVIMDNFWVGGRETFLRSNVGLLKRRSQAHVSVMADSIRGSCEFFDRRLAVGTNCRSGLRQWLVQGAALTAEKRPHLIWAHHYRLLPAWLLSVVHDVPLHVTFHGPLLGVGGMSDAQDAIGATLAIHRARGSLSAVSAEVLEQVVGQGAEKARIQLLPNKVDLPEQLPPKAGAASASGELNLVLLTREDKKAHQRAAIAFLHAMRKSGHRARLTVYTGVHPGQCAHEPASGVPAAWSTARKVGRKWVVRHPGFIFDLPFVTWRPATDDPGTAIAQSDVVLGMGRVVLEGLAARKPTVLVGYQDVIGAVTADKFHEYQQSNFSGRGVGPQSIDKVASSIADSLRHPHRDSELSKLVDIESSWPALDALLRDAAAPPVRAASADRLLARIAALAAGDIDDVAFTSGMLAELSVAERATFDALLAHAL